MKLLLRNLLLLFLLFTFILIPFKTLAIESSTFSDNSCNKTACDLRMAERKLWIDHVSWTRSYIISALASLEDKDDVAQRLLKNQDDIGNSIKPIYGEESGNALA